MAEGLQLVRIFISQLNIFLFLGGGVEVNGV